MPQERRICQKAESSVVFLPMTNTDPDCGSSSMLISFAMVDLPEPFLPRSAMCFPLSIDRETPLSARARATSRCMYENATSSRRISVNSVVSTRDANFCSSILPLQIAGKEKGAVRLRTPPPLINIVSSAYAANGTDYTNSRIAISEASPLLVPILMIRV